MSLSALSAGLSGLQSNQAALDVSAHNIANANTAGFKAQGASFQESAPAGNGVNLSVEGRSLAAGTGSGAPNSVDLASEITSGLVYKAGFDLSAKVIQAADERLGTLIDISA